MLIQNNIHTMTGAKVIINTLKAIGIDTIFGYPGGILLALYDELYNQPNIKHILVRHEQCAVHAAEGYARTSGKCGVVLVTSGPGATNTVTGIANAYLDGYPLIVLTGQVNNGLIGKDAFQEANICDMVKSCTKAAFQIKDAKDIQKIIFKAHQIAMTGKKGPVLIDIPQNIFSQNTQFEQKVMQDSDILTQCTKSDARRIINYIKNSQKPIIVIGGGVNHSKCYKELDNFIERFNIPVVATMMGLGAFKQDNPLFLGMIGIFGDNSANEALKSSDLIISLGARFNDRITGILEPNSLDNKVLQIDINKHEIGKNYIPKDYVISDIGAFLQYCNNLYTHISDKEFSNWANTAQIFRGLNSAPQKNSNMLHSFEIIQAIEQYTKDKDVIFTSEVGQHQLWAVKNLKFNPKRKILVSGGLGTMGFGLPAAIGAAIANPDKTIVCITGDGSFQMSMNELSVCKDYNLNIKIIILNNGYLGMVRQLQEKNYQRRYSQTKISNPNFEKLAQSFGIDAIKINSVTEIKEALNRAFTAKGTFIAEFEIEPMETV